MNFSAAILAGGRSSRMGCDKAWLQFDGQTLLTRQLELVRTLTPAEVFISGRLGTDYSAFDCPALTDHFPDAGPLAGIESALAIAATPLVLVLAVDMPQMSAASLRALLAECCGGMGVVPLVDGQPEPLAAVYPKMAQPIAAALLTHEARGARAFADHCRQAGLVRFLDLDRDFVSCFANWNRPEDIPPSLMSDGTPVRI